jgi:hypothetical protein
VSTGPKGLPELVDEVEKVRKELARWTEGTHGLQVHVVDRERARRIDLRRYRLEHFQQTAKTEGVLPAARALVRQVAELALWRRGLR